MTTADTELEDYYKGENTVAYFIKCVLPFLLMMVLVLLCMLWLVALWIAMSLM